MGDLADDGFHPVASEYLEPVPKVTFWEPQPALRSPCRPEYSGFHTLRRLESQKLVF